MMVQPYKRRWQQDLTTSTARIWNRLCQVTQWRWMVHGSLYLKVEVQEEDEAEDDGLSKLFETPSKMLEGCALLG